MASNAFVWYELMTSDPAAATAFYEQVLAMSGADAGMPNLAYTIVSAGGSPVGGIMAIPDEARQMGARPGWLGYIGVADVDAAAARIAAAGGAIHHPAQDIAGVGRFAVVADPHGAAFMLFKGSSDEAPPAVRRKGHPAMSAGTNCTRATVPLRSPSMPGCSAGRRTARSTWERSAPTSSLLPAARRSAAS